MKKREYSREFKMSVIREYESGKTCASICREHGIHDSMLHKWRRRYKQNPDTAFAGKGNVCTNEGKIAENERVIGQLYLENKFLKKALSYLENSLAELRKQRKVK